MKANGDEAQRGACRRRLGVAHHLHAAATRSSARSPPRVAYRGTGPALNDLVGGQVDFMLRPDRQPRRRRSRASNIKAYRNRDARSARRRCRTCRRRRRPACRNTRSAPGTRSSRPKGTPKEIIAKLNRRARQGARRREHAQAPARPRRRHPGQAPAAAPQALQKLVESRGRALDARSSRRRARRRNRRPVRARTAAACRCGPASRLENGGGGDYTRASRAAVAQLVRAPDCGSGGPPFEPGRLYHNHQWVSYKAPPDRRRW